MINKLQTANCKLQTANCKLQTANCKLQTANCKLQTANCKLQTARLKQFLCGGIVYHYTLTRVGGADACSHLRLDGTKRHLHAVPSSNCRPSVARFE
jgi:hypothetical protein